MKKLKNLFKAGLIIATIGFSVNIGATVYSNASSSFNPEIENPDPECICASHRVGGVCTGATTRLCQGGSDCKDLCG